VKAVVPEDEAPGAVGELNGVGGVLVGVAGVVAEEHGAVVIQQHESDEDLVAAVAVHVTVGGKWPVEPSQCQSTSPSAETAHMLQ